VNRPDKAVNAIGVMSGTSMDGIDIAMLKTDGENSITGKAVGTAIYPARLREQLIELVGHPEQAATGDVSDITQAVTDSHCDAVENFLSQHTIDRHTINVIGFHGQTVFHAPERGITRQLFDGTRAAKRLGIDTVCQFRLADVAAGGQGAPLAPLYHQALARASGLDLPIIILNLGGVANVTYIDQAMITAFDTGPASALLDDFVRERIGSSFDKDGLLAQSGQIQHKIVNDFLSSDYFNRSPPKSLDRNAFHAWMNFVAPLSNSDGAATLAAFTIESIIAALRHLPNSPKQWLVGGGGRHNLFFMHGLQHRLGVPVEPVESIGWNGDMLEAECFAWLAVRVLKGLPLSLPTTTGVPYPLTGGEISRASKDHT
jgi:anhydro-N-acetylmuramic acid kinase